MAVPCKTNSYLPPPPLCKNNDIRRRRKWFVQPLHEINFGKCVKSQRHDEIGEHPFVAGYVFKLTKKQHRGQDRPYLRLHGVAGSADEALDVQ